MKSAIPREFYRRDTAEVAQDLLGKRIVRRVQGIRMSGFILETEAYKHLEDPASHAFGGITERNKTMFGEVGTAYVYFTYGMHFCFNVVARHPDTLAGAVLIRSVVPEHGAARMARNRGIGDSGRLSDGPAKMTQAFEITKEQCGADLTGGELYIAEGFRPANVVAGPRVGITKATQMPWNFRMA